MAEWRLAFSVIDEGFQRSDKWKYGVWQHVGPGSKPQAFRSRNRKFIMLVSHGSTSTYSAAYRKGSFVRETARNGSVKSEEGFDIQHRANHLRHGSALWIKVCLSSLWCLTSQACQLTIWFVGVADHAQWIWLTDLSCHHLERRRQVSHAANGMVHTCLAEVREKIKYFVNIVWVDVSPTLNCQLQYFWSSQRAQKRAWCVDLPVEKLRRSLISLPDWWVFVDVFWLN